MPETKKQVILDNPFHPLDLSAHDLLTIKKKFTVSGETNRNPQQELPIEMIAQLISTLKGCKPSYVQKCMSQALIKETISWKDFLGFLDQESEVRYKILDWLIHEKAIISYKFKGEIPFRQKIERYFDNITNLNFLEIGEDKVMITSIDCKMIHLILLTDGKFEQIACYTQKNRKIETSAAHVPFQNDSQVSQKKGRKVKMDMRETSKGLNNKSMIKSERNIYERESGSAGMSSSKNNAGDEAYYKKQRKNIHSLFMLFNQLPLEEAKKVAEVATEKIRSRTVNSNHVTTLRETYANYESEKKVEEKERVLKEAKPLDRARSHLTWLNKQKSGLNYNPYRPLRSNKLIGETEAQQTSQNFQKKPAYDRKEKEYLLQSNQQKFCPELSCIGIVYYNLEVCLVKVSREYKKIVMEEQDKIRIASEKDHKKNESIEGIEFYYHRITDKWFLMILVRNEYKNEYRSQNDSYIRGYELVVTAHEWKDERSYRFASRKEEFIIDLGKNEVIDFVSQPQFGLHLITNSGKYLTWKEDYQPRAHDTLYWKKDHEDKFKGAAISFSCICVSPEISKAILGTIKGTIAIYDLFSKQHRMKKLGSCPVLQIRVYQKHAYILYENQKLVVYDILRNEEIQSLSMKNEEKLHEKVRSFAINEGKIYAYGNCIRVYEQVVDENLQHEKYKMENTYTWRISKLSRHRGKATPNPAGITNPTPALEAPEKKIKTTFRNDRTTGEMVVTSNNLICVLTEIQQVIFFSAEDLSVKFTIILDIPYDEKVMRMSLSPNEKLLAILLFSQHIYVFNIYTQELIVDLTPADRQKYTTIIFMDSKNEYMLAAGTESGKIVLIPYPSVPEKEVKLLQFHTKPISSLALTKDLLITTCENNQIAIWQLPFNVIRHDIKLKNKLISQTFFCDSLGSSKDVSYLRTLSGVVAEINVLKGQVRSLESGFTHWVACAADPLMNYLMGISKTFAIEVYERTGERSEWAQKHKFSVDSKGEVIGVAVVPGTKAVFFTQSGFAIWDYRQKTMGKFKTYVESIV